MKLLKHVIQVNQLTHVGEVINKLIRDKESDGLYSKESPAKVLIISDNLEKATYVTEVIANRMINPNEFELKAYRNQENHIQLNLLAGLPCEVYTRKSYNVSPLGLQHCDYILYIESNQLDDYIQNADCNVVIFENIFKYDTCSDDIIKYIANKKPDTYHPTVYNLLAVGYNLNEAWGMFYNMCLECKFPQMRPNTPHETLEVYKTDANYIEKVTRAIPGIPVTFTWVDNEYFSSKDIFGSYYIVLLDEII